jgi:hypothetical protein
MDPYQTLANAIVEQAVRDYRAALKDLKENPHNREAQAEKDSILRFFRSQWYTCLTQVDAEYLIKRLDKEVEA